MLSPGHVVKGEYKIEKVLGSGGMGAIYICSEAGKPDKFWALKEMNLPSVDDDMKNKALKHFEMEAEILSKLNHINLPAVKEYFKENNNYYMVMELIEGEDLGKLLDKSQEPFSEELVLKWGTQLATVLYFLHIQKPPIIYRDMKPSNIIITPDGNVKLIDFGIARFFQSGKKKDTIQMGSLGYAPPEQFGQGQTDERSDIYSLGITIHQLLTRRDPAEAENPFKIPLVRTLNTNISIELERIIQRTTQFDSERRYQKVSELKRDLKTLYDEKVRRGGAPVSNQPPTIAIRAVETEVLKLSDKDERKIKEKMSQSAGLEEEKKARKTEVTEKSIKEKKDINSKNEAKTVQQEKKKEEIKNNGEKEEIKNKKNEKKKNEKRPAGSFFSTLKTVITTFFVIFILTFLGASYYFYKNPEQIPSSMAKYINLIPGISLPFSETIKKVEYDENRDLKNDVYSKYMEGKFVEANEILKKILDKSPDDPEALILKSNIDISLNKKDSFSVFLLVSKTGNYREDGLSLMEGACMAQKEINDAWGIRGKMMKIEMIDDGSDLNIAVKNIKSLSETIALIGPNDYIIELGLENKFKNILHFSITDPINNPYGIKESTFSMTPDTKEEIENLYNLIYDNLAREKISVIFDIQNPYFFELNYIFKEEIFAKERNINEILIRGEYVDNNNNEINRVIELLDEQQPEVIVFFTSPYIINQLALKIREKNNEVIFIGGHWTVSSLLLKNSGLNGFISLCPGGSKNKIFEDNYKKTFSGKSLSINTKKTYDAFMMLRGALKNKGFKKEKIQEYLLDTYKKNYYCGISGNIYYGQPKKEMINKWKVFQIINGNFNEYISELRVK